MIVSIPSYISFAVNLMTPSVVSIKIHSRIGIVVFPGTAFKTVLTPETRFDLLQMIFISLVSFMLINVNNFMLSAYRYINVFTFVVVVVGGVDMLISRFLS